MATYRTVQGAIWWKTTDVWSPFRCLYPTSRLVILPLREVLWMSAIAMIVITTYTCSHNALRMLTRCESSIAKN